MDEDDSFDEDEGLSKPTTVPSHPCINDHRLAGCSRAEDSGNPELEPGNNAGNELIDNDYPDLIPVLDNSECDESEQGSPMDEEFLRKQDTHRTSDNFPNLEMEMLAVRVAEVLASCQPYPGDGIAVDPTYLEGDPRFVLEPIDHDLLQIYDWVQVFEAHIHISQLWWADFSIGRWFAEQCTYNMNLPFPYGAAQRWAYTRNWQDTTMNWTVINEEAQTTANGPPSLMELGGVQVDRNKYPSLQRNAAQVKGNHRVLPKPIVIKISINGHPARTLLDSGSLRDFMSSTLADQLSVLRKTLESLLPLQLAVQGSRSKVNAITTVRVQYQDIDEERTFNIININNYNLILGTPWMYQHKICVGFNPARVIIGSDNALPLQSGADTKLMVSAVGPDERLLEKTRNELKKLAEPLCREVHETELPLFRAINHTIPLIDESKTYTWRPSRCPEAFRAQWAEKRDAYLKSGRWKITTAGNTVPMLLIPKPKTDPPALWIIVDLRERNKNTR